MTKKLQPYSMHSIKKIRVACFRRLTKQVFSRWPTPSEGEVEKIAGTEIADQTLGRGPAIRTLHGACDLNEHFISPERFRAYVELGQAYGPPPGSMVNEYCFLVERWYLLIAKVAEPINVLQYLVNLFGNQIDRH